jgi:hypothetical protein
MVYPVISVIRSLHTVNRAKGARVEATDETQGGRAANQWVLPHR